MDWKLVAGRVPFVKPPIVLGGDVAGVVEEAPAGSGFKAGDRVFACCGHRWGGYAEYITLPTKLLAKIPEKMTFKEAAGVPLAGMTALDSLNAANLKEGQHVLIHAGSGGVGSAAIQIAKARGLKVTTTCSGRNVEFCKSLGADAVIDYTTQRFEDAIEKPVDAVIDTINGDYEDRSLGLLSRSGVYVNVLGGKPSLGKIVKNKFKGMVRFGPRYAIIMLFSNGKKLEEIGKLIEEGKVKPIVQATYPLAEAKAALAVQKEGRVRGKLVLVVDPELADK